MELKLPSPLEELHDSVIEKAGIRLFVKRDDFIHPTISGNKWRKLKYNIEAFQKGNDDAIITFGGAYSNHIHATAAAGKLFGIKTIGLIRGEESFPLNKTLSDAKQWGMHLEYIDRTSYRNKSTPEFLDKIKQRFGKVFIIPEGGANEHGVKGCEEIIPEINIAFDTICCACGTGTTVSGLINSTDKQVIGFPVLKGGDFLREEINHYVGTKPYELQTDYHFGGYAKTKPELFDFITNFENEHQILLDQVYTGKLFYGIYDLMKKGFFEKETTVVALHTGGVQGKKQKI